MAEIILVRHGQASFGAANYDQLSELGSRQAQWLGEHLRALGRDVDSVFMGDMARHRQTAEAILQGLGRELELHIQPGLNEYRFQGLLDPLRTQHPHLWQETGNAGRDYYFNMQKAMSYWMDGTISDDGLDSWESFSRRIRDAFDTACGTGAKRTLVVSSGGPIAVILGQLLGLDNAATRQLALQIKNSSCSTLLSNGHYFTLDSFNDVSHLMSTERQHAITFT
ncbi:histidine phosphatase family protein [Pseudomaricurvus sp. HS19]|uniref:histidine phosphatase family protein n=1 Tax=Pseudomaricurvus sp. HS19 TaxID=2692626 RepID=UPI0013721600|nr:histidine phosphatase family protein [Pseudomaricurvus sp. HS19]MYM62831.1 histidine phosphatase family protein [Pseudomaricurvus sp. HS19]